jgi:hypothetical protein
VGAIDGLKGPQTRHAFEVLAARQRGIEGVENWRDFDHAAPGPRRGADAPAPSAARRNINWPSQSQREMEKFFGPVGANQATLDLPEGYSMRIAWEPSKTDFHASPATRRSARALAACWCACSIITDPRASAISGSTVSAAA